MKKSILTSITIFLSYLVSAQSNVPQVMSLIGQSGIEPSEVEGLIPKRNFEETEIRSKTDSINLQISQKVSTEEIIDFPIYGQNLLSKTSSNNSTGYFNQENYLLGPGDKIKILVSGRNNFEKTIVLDFNGRIKLDDFGVVAAYNKPLSDVRQSIASLLKKRISLEGSSLDINLVGSRQMNVIVNGEVRNPGTVVIHGYENIFDAIGRAGGITNKASVREIVVRRETGETLRFDFYKLLSSKDLGLAWKYALQPGDYILVETVKKTVFINGEVVRSGRYELLENEKLESLINSAEGLSHGSNENFVTVFGIRDGHKIAESVRDTEFSLYQLFDGDSVFIYKVENDVENFVHVFGSKVTTQGKVFFNTNESVQSLANRLGYSSNTAADSIIVIEEILNTMEFQKRIIGYDNSANESLKAHSYYFFGNENNFLKDERVFLYGFNSGYLELPLSEGFTLKEAILYAGGFKKSALYSIDIYNESDEIAQRILYNNYSDYNSFLGSLDKIGIQNNHKIVCNYVQMYNDPVIVFNSDDRSKNYYFVPKQGKKIMDFKSVYGLNEVKRTNDFIEVHRVGFPDISFIAKSPNYNFTVYPGDSLCFLKFRPEIKITILKDINDTNVTKRTINYEPNKGIKFYLRKGVLSSYDLKNIDFRKLTIRYPNGRVQKTFQFLNGAYSTSVSEGAEITVFMKQKKNFGQLNFDFQSFISSSTQLVLSYATIRALLL